jgi:hypothetical protein
MTFRALLVAAAALAATAVAQQEHEWEGDFLHAFDGGEGSTSLFEEVDRLDDVVHAFGRSLAETGEASNYYAAPVPTMATTTSSYMYPVAGVPTSSYTTSTTSQGCPVNCGPETKRMLGRDLQSLLGVTEVGRGAGGDARFALRSPPPHPPLPTLPTHPLPFLLPFPPPPQFQTAIGIKKAVEDMLDQAIKAQALADSFAAQCSLSSGGNVYPSYPVTTSTYGNVFAADYSNKPGYSSSSTSSSAYPGKVSSSYPGKSSYPPVLGIPTVRYPPVLGSSNPCELAAKYAAESAALRASASALIPQLASALAQGSSLVARIASVAEQCRLVVTMPAPIYVQAPAYQAPTQAQPQYQAPTQAQPQYQAPTQAQPQYQAPTEAQPTTTGSGANYGPTGSGSSSYPTTSSSSYYYKKAYSYPTASYPTASYPTASYPTASYPTYSYPPVVSQETAALLACLRRLDDLLQAARDTTRRALKLVVASQGRENALAAAENALAICLGTVTSSPYYPVVTSGGVYGGGRYLADDGEPQEEDHDDEADHDVHAAWYATSAAPPCYAERARVNALAQSVCESEVALFSSVAELVRIWAAVDQTSAVCFPVQAPAPYYPTTSAPTYSTPTTAAPQYNMPVASAPQYNMPVASAPQYNMPVASAPQYSAPVTSAPQYSAPVALPPNAYRRLRAAAADAEEM